MTHFKFSSVNDPKSKNANLFNVNLTSDDLPLETSIEERISTQKDEHTSHLYSATFQCRGVNRHLSA